MASPLAQSPGADGLLPVTGFGPGTILIAVIGGVLTVLGAVARRLGRRPATG